MAMLHRLKQSRSVASSTQKPMERQANKGASPPTHRATNCIAEHTSTLHLATDGLKKGGSVALMDSQPASGCSALTISTILAQIPEAEVDTAVAHRLFLPICFIHL